MAANSASRGIVNVGKLLYNQVRLGVTRDPTHTPSLTLRRAVHFSVYDKNLEEHVHPTIVPDDIIHPQSDKYWAPHPQTGVFGPATEHTPDTGGERGFYTLPEKGDVASVLEQKAFFRSLEDLEKPPHY